MTDVTTQTGIEALAAMFARAKDEKRSAFLPYFPLGYPTYEESLDAIEMMAREGVDGFEIGMPFSDPLADGPTIQVATQRALENGVTIQKCIDGVRELRRRGVTQPMLMFGYLNPILAYGVERFTVAIREAGAHGIICPDLPPDEGGELMQACAREGLAMVFFLAPTSNDRRIQIVNQVATGFIYVLSLTGVTGERTQLPPDLTEFIARLKAEVKDKPLVLGFGISTPDHAQAVNHLTDGFIVGSALVKAAGQGGAAAARDLAASIRAVLNRV